MATITAELRGGPSVRLDDGRHTWTADEPPDVGGTDTGPTPYEMLLGSLAACTCITVWMYCRRKGWALTSVTTRLHHDRVHSRDCDDCDKKTSGYIDRITSHVEIDGDFDDSQRQRLREVATRCPVHKTLDRGVTLQDEVTVA